MRFYESQTLERVGFDFYCDMPVFNLARVSARF